MIATEPTFYSRRVKRLLDLAVSFLLIVFTSPIQVACGLAVVLFDGKPIFFTQKRTGRNGRPIAITKFRTMTPGTEARANNYPSPEMVTTVGRLLRRTSLDELPQLKSVLIGEMSLVGPRPALQSQVDRYTHEQRERLRVRPGLTGLAQIRHRNNAPWSVRIDVDREYIESISFLGDMKILLLTIPAALKAEGQMIGQSFYQVDDLYQSSAVAAQSFDHPGGTEL